MLLPIKKALAPEQRISKDKFWKTLVEERLTPNSVGREKISGASPSDRLQL